MIESLPRFKSHQTAINEELSPSRDGKINIPYGASSYLNLNDNCIEDLLPNEPSINIGGPITTTSNKNNTIKKAIDKTNKDTS